MHERLFTFTHYGQLRTGRIALPDREAGAAILLVPGHGRTDVPGQFDLERQRFTALGLAVGSFDRAGCGNSDGVYDHYQSIEDQGEELAHAHRAFAQAANVPLPRIGWWGISRAGWICPLAIPHLTQGPAFWISVSGGGRSDNFPFLLRTNLAIEGRSEAAVAALMGEFDSAFAALVAGQDHQAYLDAQPRLREDLFYRSLGMPLDAGTYDTLKVNHQSGVNALDAAGNLARQRRVDAALARMRCPVLALFGACDTNLNWRDTAGWYVEHLGTGAEADLTIRVFPHANHCLVRCTNGGISEMVRTFRDGGWQHAEGFFPTMEGWLAGRGFTAS